MNPEERQLRSHAAMVEASNIFWEEKISEAIDILENMEEYETPEEFHQEELELEQELKYLLMKSAWEQKEMIRLEKKIKRYIDDNEG